MILNTQRLQYLLEIESTGSISHAAENLFTAQSNLSRILRETEAQVGFQIFDRTGSGVVPTKQGKIFLLHAKTIIEETKFINELSEEKASRIPLSICLPSSPRLVNLFTSQFIANRESFLDDYDFSIEECSTNMAFERLLSDNADMIIARYHKNQQSALDRKILDNDLICEPLTLTAYQLVFSKVSPLAGYMHITEEDLKGRDCIICPPVELNNGPDHSASKIKTNNRTAQLHMLSQMPEAYGWSETIPYSLLSYFGLMQYPLGSPEQKFMDVLVYRNKASYPEAFNQILNRIRILFNVKG